MKIVDCFTFFNELDLLEFRLKLLAPYIDRFIIAESNYTHSGQPKEFHFRANQARFQPWLHKIHYIPLQQSVEGLAFEEKETSYNPASASWKLENEQRNALAIAATMINENDRVVIGDLDEIPDPRLLTTINLDKDPVALSQLFHYYFMNCQNTGNERWWNGTIVCTGKQFTASTPQLLRDRRNDLRAIKKAGWHFSYLGGLEKIKYKIRSFAHTEFNKEEFTNDQHIMDALEKGEDIFKRPGVSYKFVSLYYYPAFLRKVMEQYPEFIHQKKKDRFGEKIYYNLKRVLTR